MQLVSCLLQPTKKIWMDGKFVSWKDAKVHFLTHALHYGSGVFEGIRAYPLRTEPTTRAIFRLSDHLVRLASSAMILSMSRLSLPVNPVWEMTPGCNSVSILSIVLFFMISSVMRICHRKYSLLSFLFLDCHCHLFNFLFYKPHAAGKTQNNCFHQTMRT